MTDDTVDEEWERDAAALWAAIDDHSEGDFRARIDELVSRLPAGSPIGRFERAAAFDSTGSPEQAVPLYEAALAAGLSGTRRRRATIQLASSLRNLGRPDETVRLLEAERAASSDELDGAVATFLALGLVDVGREREAVGVALTALATYLPRYNRSVTRYAADLLPSAEPDA